MIAYWIFAIELKWCELVGILNRLSSPDPPEFARSECRRELGNLPPLTSLLRAGSGELDKFLFYSNKPIVCRLFAGMILNCVIVHTTHGAEMVHESRLFFWFAM